MTQYQVVGECAHVTTMTASGVGRVLLYRPAVLPADVPESEIGHLLARKLIAPFGAVAGPATEEPEKSAADQSVDDVKVPALTPSEVTRPQQADPKARWVDYAVEQGMDRDEATKASKADLIAALKG